MVSAIIFSLSVISIVAMIIAPTTDNSPLRIGLYLFGFASVFSMWFISVRSSTRTVSRAALPSALLALLYFVWALDSPSLYNFKPGILIAMSMAYYLVVRSQSLTVFNEWLVILIVLIAECVLILFLYQTGGVGSIHKNHIGVVVLSLALVTSMGLIKIVGMPTIVVAGSSAVVTFVGILVDHRTVAVCGFAIFPVYVVLRWIELSRFALMSVFVSLVLFSIGIVVIMNPELGYIQSVSADVMDISGRRINSGRERIWPLVVRAIGEKPWTGWGASAEVPDYSYLFDWTAHNQFLQIGYQIGIPGMILFAWILWGVWKDLTLVHTPSPILALGRLGYIMLIVILSVDVALNAYIASTSLAVWLPIGIAASLASYQKSQMEDSNAVQCYGL